jgi:hypothetical protein
MKIEYKPFKSNYYEDKTSSVETISLQTEYFAIMPTTWQQLKDWIMKVCFNDAPKYQSYCDKITALIEESYNKSVDNSNDVLYQQHVNDIHYVIANDNTIKELIKYGVNDDYIERRVDLIMFHIRAKICLLTMRGNDARGVSMYKNQSAYEVFMKKWMQNI